jgi:hypothetical protein
MSASTTTNPRGFAPWRPQVETSVRLDQVNEILEEYKDNLPLTCRQIFYRMVGAYQYPKPKPTTITCSTSSSARGARG